MTTKKDYDEIDKWDSLEEEEYMYIYDGVGCSGTFLTQAEIDTTFNSELSGKTNWPFPPTLLVDIRLRRPAQNQ